MKQVAQQLITQKLKNLTIEELIFYSQKYDIPISKTEAKAIVKELKKNKENPFEADGRKRMLMKLASITSKETARSVNRILIQVAKEYGVDHWLN